jgi:hypothetical protein
MPISVSPMPDSRTRPRRGLAAGGNGVWGEEPTLERPWVVLLSTLLLLSYLSLSLGLSFFRLLCLSG